MRKLGCDLPTCRPMLINNLSLTSKCNSDREASSYAMQRGKRESTGTLLSQTTSLYSAYRRRRAGSATHTDGCPELSTEPVVGVGGCCFRFKLLGLLTLSKTDRN